MGDTERWMATPASSGDPSNSTPHLVIKPQAPGIGTNLTIYTTKHIYHLQLRSRSKEAMQQVEFYYPEDLLAAMREADQAAQTAKTSPPSRDAGWTPEASLDPSHLNFGYSVSGPQLPWKPLRAFDDGTRFIQMPDSLHSGEAPAARCLRATEPDGELSRSRRLLRR